MAEALILLVLGKIGAIVAEEAIKSLYSGFEKEVSLLQEIEGRIKQIAPEFRVIKAFLSQTETIERNNSAFEALLQEVREVAHEVEDVLDEYAYITGELCCRLTRWFKRKFYKSKSIVSLLAIANQLKGIETRLQKISDMRSRYDIKFQGENSSNIVSKIQELTASSSYLIDQDGLVGIEEEKQKLIMWLKDDETVDRSTIAVWGMGGLGKTSLVKSVLNSREVKEHFDCYTWISVSQKFEVVDILKKIIKDALVSMHEVQVNTESMDHLKLVQTARETLEGKKYLIILDDVWTRDVCIYFRDAFGDNCNGSKIVITTRIKEVAESCGGRYLELKSLCEEEAWDLFCRRAFKYEERRCPQAVEKWARKIVSKCQGLPLALVAIGSLMSDRAKTETEWRRFYDQFNWELNKNENATELNWVKRALNLSYHYLPSYLKSCFLYCCIFPEDYLIKTKKLIRLWIAEGFISLEGRGRQTHEELAEVYLDELIQRCMLQVVERDSRGIRVKACRIHDIVRELTITTSREQDFCVVVDDEEQTRKGDKVRRLSLHVCNDNILRGINSVSLRSFISFGTTLNSSLSRLSSLITGCKYLRVLDLEGMKIEKLPDGVMDLFNLHHLGLRKTDIKKLPESIGRLHNLQTLDLRGTEVEKLPHGVTELKNLRNLLVGGSGFRVEAVAELKNVRFHAVKAPNGLAELKNLRTLKRVTGSKNLVRGLGNLTQLRSLHIFDVANFVELCTSIAKMPFLSNLLVVFEEETFLSSSLFCSLGNSLQKLGLARSMLREDPLPSLFHLSNLTSLVLGRESYLGQQLWFRRGWFPHLTNLKLTFLAWVEKVEIENGALQSLEYLFLGDLDSLVSVPSGIEFLTTLKVLWLNCVRDELVERIKEADYSKISHIPTIHRLSRNRIYTNLSLLLKKGRG